MSTNKRLVKYILYIHKWKTMQLLKKNEVNPQYPKSGTLGGQANNVGRYKPGRARGRLVRSKPREGSLPCNAFAWRPHQWLEETQCFHPQVGYKQEPSQSGLCRRGRRTRQLLGFSCLSFPIGGGFHLPVRSQHLVLPGLLGPKPCSMVFRLGPKVEGLRGTGGALTKRGRGSLLREF